MAGDSRRWPLTCPPYNGTTLAKKGVIVVTPNYRLGALGFLAHPLLDAESPHNASGNYGIMDQQAALQWVRKNIEKFGGDPSRVTIFGQSAGAESVLVHVASPTSKGLFRQGIVESGPFWAHGAIIDATHSKDYAEQFGVNYATGLGPSPTSGSRTPLCASWTPPPRLCPDGAWAQRLEWNGKSVRLTGFAPASMDLQSAVANSPVLLQARASSTAGAAKATGVQPFDIPARRSRAFAHEAVHTAGKPAVGDRLTGPGRCSGMAGGTPQWWTASGACARAPTAARRLRAQSAPAFGGSAVASPGRDAAAHLDGLCDPRALASLRLHLLKKRIAQIAGDEGALS